MTTKIRQHSSFRKDSLLLLFSLLAFYVLGPSLDRIHGVWVSMSFALILILSSRMILDIRHVIRYFVYITISCVTYYFLNETQSWDLLLVGGIFESSALPVMICCLAMSFAGWLLLPDYSSRVIYSLVTLSLQIPVAFLVGSEFIQDYFHFLSKMFFYSEGYSGALAFWQFEWMVTYYLPIYFLARMK